MAARTTRAELTCPNCDHPLVVRATRLHRPSVVQTRVITLVNPDGTTWQQTVRRRVRATQAA